MDTSAFSEDLSRLYAEFADSIRENDSESVRNAYKQLRNSGRPITEILNEAIRTVGVSHGELEKHLLGEHDSKPVNQGHDIGPSDLLEPAFPDPNAKPDTTATTFDHIPAHEPSATLFAPPSLEYSVGLTGLHLGKQNSAVPITTEASSIGFYVRLAAWAFVVGMTGFVLVIAIQILTVSLSSTSKPVATTNRFGATPTNGVDMPAAQKVEMPAAQKDVGPRVSSPAPLNSVTAVPPATGSDLKIDGAVTTPRAPAKPDAETTAAQPSIQGKAGAIGEDTSLLLERGDSLFRIGDVTSARGFYERAAEKGNGQAALRLGESYDPSFLQQANLRSVRADISAAVLWYERARDLGVTEAQILLKHAKGE